MASKLCLREDRSVEIFSSDGSRHMPASCITRGCRFEQLETREMLAADLLAAVPSLSLPGAAAANLSGNVYAEAEGAVVGMANVRVQLLNESGVVIEEKLTDLQGVYEFSGLIPGIYALQEITPVGYSDGLSQIGSGGGIVFNQNLFGEIVVGPGETLLGYNFFDTLGTPEQNFAGDRPIVAHGGGNLGGDPTLQILTLTLQSTPVRTSEMSFESAFVLVIDNAPSEQTSFSSTREEPVFGGSSRVPDRSSPTRALDESPFDSLFSLTEFWELASTNLPTLQPLGHLVDEVGSGLQEWFGKVEELGEESESAATEQAAQPKIARRYDLPEVREVSEREVGPNRNRTARDEHAEAIDEIFAAENSVDYRS